MKSRQRPWSVLLPLLLAACASTSLPSARARPDPLRTTGPATTVADIDRVAAPPASAPRPAPSDVWQRLRGSFAMGGCDADPAVLPWAHSYTRNPQRFEARIKAALPRLVYVQESAERHDVAGEFALLPWVESHYRPAPPVRAGRPAGIWQIIPATAGAMGLQINRTYDGRLDLAASTEGVMRLLHAYHERYGDWTLADHAYSAGESAMRRRHGLSSGGAGKTSATGPNPASHAHLVKLLAIACVVREPARFGVTLPGLPAGQHLVAVTVDHSMPLAQAAVHAGMSTAALSKLNAAFRNGVVDTRYADQLLLPKSRAAQFRDAMQSVAQTGDAPAASHAQAHPQGQVALAAAQQVPAAGKDAPSTSQARHGIFRRR